MKKRILLTVSVLMLIVTLCISLCACGSEEENSRIESKGLFVLEQSEDFDLSKEGELSEHEAYLIHVYDIIPDERENAETGLWASSYTVTLNNTNEYETVASKGSSGGFVLKTQLNNFIIASRYVVDSEVGHIYGGQEPIRVISAFIVNKNDVHEDTVVDFHIKDSGIYNCDMSFQGEEIQKIQFFDEIYNIEENPHEYQLASAMYIRANAIKNSLKFFSKNNGAESVEAVLVTGTVIHSLANWDIASTFGDSGEVMYYDFDSNTCPSTADTIIADREEIIAAVEKVHPEISDATKVLLENGTTWIEDAGAYAENPSQQTAAKADNTEQALYEASCSIIEYFEEQ